MSTPTPTRFIVKTSAANMPASCWGRYRRVAVIEVADGVSDVAMISERARGVVRIVETWERCNVGKQQIRCAYSRALAEAREIAANLNAEAAEAAKRLPVDMTPAGIAETLALCEVSA